MDIDYFGFPALVCMTDFAAVTLITLSALGLGSAIARISRESPLVSASIYGIWLAGFGLLGSVLFVVGLFRFGRTSVLMIVIPPLGFLGFVPWKRLARRSAVVFRKNPYLWGTTFVFVGIVLLAAFSPPVGDAWTDSIRYHLYSPRRWIAEGKIRIQPDQTETAFPCLIESLFAAGMSLGTPVTSQILGLVFGALLLGCVWAVSRSLGGSLRAAAVSCLLVVTMGGLFGLANQSLVDIPLSAFAIAFVLALANEGRGFTAGLLGGAMVGTKYPGIVLLAIGLTVGFLGLPGTMTFAKRCKKLLLVSAIALLVSCPWYLRNWAVLGAPIFPPIGPFASLFPGAHLSEETARNIIGYHSRRGMGMGRGVQDFFLLPVRLTLWPEKFHAFGGFGLGLLALAPVGAVRAATRGRARAWFLWMFLVTLVWFIAFQEARFLSPVIAVGSCFAGLGADYLFGLKKRVLSMAASVPVVTSVGVGFVTILLGQIPRVRAGFSTRFAASYERENIPFWGAIHYLNSDRSVTRVLILSASVAPYFIDRPFRRIVGTWGERPFPEMRTIGQALSRAPGEGFSHLIDVDEPGHGFAVPPSISCLKLVFEAKDARIYRFGPDGKSCNLETRLPELPRAMPMHR